MKKKIFYISIPLILVIAAIFLFFIKEESKKVTILFYNVGQMQSNAIIELLKSDELNITYDSYQKDVLPLNELLEVNNYDLIFSNEYREVMANNHLLTKINANMGVTSSTIRGLGMVKNKRFALPLEIDHVELAIKKDVYRELYIDENSIINIDELNSSLVKRTSPVFFPLMIAGADDLSLLDSLSLLTVSFCGKNGFNTLLEAVESKSFDEILKLDLGNSNTLKIILNQFIEWEKNEILHNEWLKFTKDTVYSFAKDNLTSAIIMRLSEHRDYELDIISNFQAVKFPSTLDKKYATDILAIPLVAAIPKNSKSNNNKELIKLCIQDNFQKKFTYSTGLSPIHSNIVPMDIQASDVRFWIASSNSIIPPVYHISEKDKNVVNFLKKVREYINTNTL